MLLLFFRFKPFLALAALLMGTRILCAQIFDATHLSGPAEFSMPVLVHAGDDPNWSRPDFDDSKWMVVDPNRDLTEYIPAASRAEIIWYRLHVRVSPSQTGLALQEMYLSNAFEIYVNGRRILENGSVSPFIPYTYYADLHAPISDAEIATGSLTIALRVHISKSEWGDPYPGLNPFNLALGMEPALRDRFLLSWIGDEIQTWANDLLFVGLGIVALALFVTQRERTEYLWLFLVGILFASYQVRSAILTAHNFPLWSLACSNVLNPIFEICLIGLGLSFIGVKPGPRIKLLIGIAALLAWAGLAAKAFEWIGTPVQTALWLPIEQIAFVGVPAVFLVQFRRGNREAGILLIPWLMQTVLIEITDAAYWLSQMPGVGSAIAQRWGSISVHQVGQFAIRLNGIVDTLVVGSWALILVWRTIRISREQARMEGELEAARQIQQVILPQEKYAMPGFTVEAVYKPAQQVGGDFFQVLAAPADGLLLVVGDVAGKGMPAAMLVAVLVGAARTIARFTSDPAEILAELNVRLLGRTSGGFSTCLVAHIDSAGTARLANAGHLAPYLDGREIETSGALPLGIAPNQSYETCSFQFEPGSRLTFYSDGVVEAQNKSGDMLGFDRARALSNRPAQEITSTAAEFGQQDDITVIVVERQPARQPLAASAPTAGSGSMASMPLEPA
jgi:phosphoserine phosphatase RsbU/P